MKKGIEKISEKFKSYNSKNQTLYNGYVDIQKINGYSRDVDNGCCYNTALERVRNSKYQSKSMNVKLEIK